MPSATGPPHLNVAIIGSGPAGLASAIALSKLPNVSVKLYEQYPELREIGAGISIGYNGWKVLELLGAAHRVTGGSPLELKRNGYTGEIVFRRESDIPDHPQKRIPVRTRRTRLQAALAAEVPEGVIEFNKKLSSLEDLAEGGVRLTFKDGTQTTADLVVGADGKRSAVRKHILPDFTLRYIGQRSYRVLIPVASVSHLVGTSPIMEWWHGKNGMVFVCPVDDPSQQEMLEISCRTYNEPELDGQVSWGVPASTEKVVSFYKDFDPKVTELLSQVPDGQFREFSLYSGPWPERLTGWDKLVLTGDASHPLSGAFGSGAAFAMEDGWVLARAIEHSRGDIANALRIFESIRAPYYLRMYQHREKHQAALQKEEAAAEDFESVLRARNSHFGPTVAKKLEWVHKNDIQENWDNYRKSEVKIEA